MYLHEGAEIAAVFFDGTPLLFEIALAGFARDGVVHQRAFENKLIVGFCESSALLVIDDSNYINDIFFSGYLFRAHF